MAMPFFKDTIFLSGTFPLSYLSPGMDVAQTGAAVLS